jgi:hypothetical protein
MVGSENFTWQHGTARAPTGEAVPLAWPEDSCGMTLGARPDASDVAMALERAIFRACRSGARGASPMRAQLAPERGWRGLRA